MAGSDTLQGYENRVRQYLHEPNASSSFWSSSFLQSLVNAAYRKRCTQLVSAHEGYFTMFKEIPVIALQEKYPWPVGFERLIKLEAAVRSEGTRVPLERNERHSYGVGRPNSFLAGIAPTYRPIGGGFILEPAFNDGLSGESEIVFTSFDKDLTSFSAANANLFFNTTNFKSGTASLQLDGTTTLAKILVMDLAASPFSFKAIEPVGLTMYIPSTVAVDIIFVTLYSPPGVSNFSFYSISTIQNGWNSFSINTSSPIGTAGTGVDLSNVTRVDITVNAPVGMRPLGVLFDSIKQFEPSPNPEYFLILEYTGLPPRLQEATDTLHDDFPVSFDELLVLDAAVSAMASESALESGQVRALVRERAEWEVSFLKYIDSRMVSQERVEPFVGHYTDA